MDNIVAPSAYILFNLKANLYPFELNAWASTFYIRGKKENQYVPFLSAPLMQYYPAPISSSDVDVLPGPKKLKMPNMAISSFKKAKS